MDPAGLTIGPDVAGAAGRPRPPGPPGSELLATVTWIDRFGNAQLDLDPAALFAIGLVPGGTVRITGDAGPSPADVGAGPARPVRAGYGRRQLGGELGLLGCQRTDGPGRSTGLGRARALGLSGPGPSVRIAAPPGAAPT